MDWKKKNLQVLNIKFINFYKLLYLFFLLIILDPEAQKKMIIEKKNYLDFNEFFKKKTFQQIF